MHQVPVISIIDDDESVRLATSSLIQSLGFVVRTFTSAEEFFRSSPADETACLITDLRLPGMSGIELQELLVAEGRRTPVIIITAFPEDRIRTQSLKLGAIGFLGKPFDGKALVECLDEALRRA